MGAAIDTLTGNQPKKGPRSPIVMFWVGFGRGLRRVELHVGSQLGKWPLFAQTESFRPVQEESKNRQKPTAGVDVETGQTDWDLTLTRQIPALTVRNQSHRFGVEALAR